MKIVTPLLAACAALSLSCAALAAPGWIIATPSETIQSGETLQLEAVRPDESTPWPAFLRLKLIADQQTEIIIFYPDATAPASGFRQVYAAALPPSLSGQLKMELADVASNRLMLLATAPDAQASNVFPETVGRIDTIPVDEPALSAHEPAYFLVGTRNGLNARYQLSFKYRIFDAESSPAQWWPALGQLHFGYTQTAVWDLDVNSKPFHDTSYRPSLFWQKRLDNSGDMPHYLRAGFEHESNGREGANSRSINLAYIQPAWRADFNDGNSLIFAPRFYSYLDKVENPDIARYRGYADWLLRYGDESEWVVSGRARVSNIGHSSTQLDLSIPFRKPLFARTGGFIHFQYFNGYGETLLDYNQRHSAQLRVGFSIVR